MRQATDLNLVQRAHLHVARNDAISVNSECKLTKPANILLYTWWGDYHRCINLVCAIPTHGWGRVMDGLQLHSFGFLISGEV